MAHDIFISYSSKDKTIADTVCAKLEERKIRCWIAPRDIPAGQNFAKSIISAINECAVFVLVWSASTNTSEHILNEINQAFDQGITIIPFRIQDVQPTLEMRYYFGRTHWLDALTPPLETHIGTLAGTIQTLLAKKREVTPEPIPIKTKGAGDEKKREEKTPLLTPREGTKPVPIGEEGIEPTTKLGVKPGSIPRVEKQSEFPEIEQPGVTAPKQKVFLPILAGVMVVATLVTMYLLGVFKGPSAAVKTVDPSVTIPVLTATLTPTTKINTATLTATLTATTPTVTPLPAWANGFSGQVMTAITYREPDFQDDFSYRQIDWEFEDIKAGCPNTYTRIISEKLKMIADNGCWTWADLPRLDLHNFATQIDMNFQQDKTSGEIVIKGGAENADFIFNFNDEGQWNVFYYLKSPEVVTRQESGFSRVDLTKPVTITMVFTETETAIYINSKPVYHDSVVKNRTQASYFSLTVQQYNNSNNILEFDNLQIWDLDKINSLNLTSTPEN